jgi:HK97 family phage major capsid protein
MSTLSERVQTRIAELESQQAEVGTELNAIATDPEARGLDDDAALARIAELRTVGENLAANLATATEQLAAAIDAESRQASAAAVRPQTTGIAGAYVRSEERTYSQHNQHERSFLTDAWNGFHRRTDPDAIERIERHMREVRLERRDISSSTLNGLVPPVYVLNQAAILARPGRPFANIVPSYDLPPNGMSVIATRVTTGTGVDVQTELGNFTETNMVTTDLTIPVCSIVGQQDVSRQAVERGALTDQLVFNDLIAAYAERLDSQLLAGSGSAAQHRGLLNVATISLQTYSDTAISTFFSKLAGNMNDVATKRFRPATVVIMHPRRWHHLVAASDSTGRPLVVPAALGPMNAEAVGVTGAQEFVGTIAGGLPVLVDANVPTNQGTSTNEDRVFVARVEDFALWEENGGVPRVFNFEQTLGPATIRLAVYGVSAFTAGRYPSGISMMTGTGLVAPTF